MKKNMLKKYGLGLGLMLLLLAYAGEVRAGAAASVETGTWNTTTTWNPAAVPVAATDVTIVKPHIVTVDINSAVCNTMRVCDNNSTGTATLKFNANAILTVTGAVTVGNGNNKFGVIDMANGGTLICSNLTVDGANAENLLIPGSGTIQLTGTGTLPASPTGFATFNNLTISSGITTLGQATTVKGRLQVNTGATLATGTNNIIAGRLTLPGLPEGVNGQTYCGTGGSCPAANQYAAITGTGTITVNFSLPVTLTHFTGRSVGTAAELEWGTSWEQNNQGFEVQRSRDGQTWDVAAFIPAKGKSGANQIYQYTDQPGAGRWYYRLKQIDYDGRFEIFQVISLELAGAELYPNPVTDQLWVTTTADENILRIQDLNGRILQQLRVGAGVQTISVQQLPKGMYLLQVEAAGDRRALRFVKE